MKVLLASLMIVTASLAAEVSVDEQIARALTEMPYQDRYQILGQLAELGAPGALAATRLCVAGHPQAMWAKVLLRRMGPAAGAAVPWLLEQVQTSEEPPEDVRSCMVTGDSPAAREQRRDHYVALVRRDLFDPKVPDYLRQQIIDRRSAAPQHPVVDEVKTVYRERLAAQPSAELALHLARRRRAAWPPPAGHAGRRTAAASGRDSTDPR